MSAAPSTSSMRTPSSPGSAALVVGIGTAVAMWGAGFLGRIPSAELASPVLLAILLFVGLGGGAIAGRCERRGIAAGAFCGMVTALINLLVLGSLISGERPNELLPSAAQWIPGSIVFGTALGALGAAVGKRLFRSFGEEPNWNGALARVAALATLLLVMIGGLVTSHDAGLAVVDWPNSYGYAMFLYPLSRMVGDIFYEHAHRLFGTLVGLTTLVLAIRLAASEPRRWVKGTGALALLMVIGQGILGGLRVTGYFTMSDSPELTRPSTALAMVHGVTGQIFFALMVSLAVFTSRTWRRAAPVDSSSVGADRALTGMLVLALGAQMILGVHARHTGNGVMTHLTFAVVPVVLATIVGVRILANYSEIRALRKSTGSLLGHVLAQLILGFLAFVAVGRAEMSGEMHPSGVVITTAHQTLGAIVLANAVVVALWCRRLLTQGAPSPASHAAARSRET